MMDESIGLNYCEAELNIEEILFFLKSENSDVKSFRNVQNHFRKMKNSRLLTTNERKNITNALNMYQNHLIDKFAVNDTIESQNILIFTSYSKDYNLGPLCEYVNKQYASKHGYLFESFVLPYLTMLEDIKPKTHCTWYKVKLINQYIQNTEYIESNNIKYIMWIYLTIFISYFN